mgnify:CR=1 FL=1
MALICYKGSRVERADIKAKEILNVFENYTDRRDQEIILRNCLSSFAQNEQLLEEGKEGFEYPADPEKWL